MNRFTLTFSKHDLEKEYFQTVAFPHYFKIFSIWCKLLIFFAIPAVIYTYATDNFQYVGYTFCIIASAFSLFTVHKKPAAFNYIIAIYNLSFVALNVLFILNTNKNIGAQGSDNVMMFIFAGSQYTFHFILSMGSSFLFKSITILLQNIAYSIVFFPGTLNSFNCLLFFATSFLIWVKYSNESQQRTIFLLQKEEEEWSFFIREVLPSSVLMVKYDQQSEEISTKLINRAAAREYNINDGSSLKGFMRNTYLDQMKSNNNVKKLEITGINGGSRPSSSESSKITGINSQFSRLNRVQNLEQYIFVRFKQLISPKAIQTSPSRQEYQKQDYNYSRPNKLQEEQEDQNQSKKEEEQQQQSWQQQQLQQTCGFLSDDKSQLENSQQLPYFRQQSAGKSQFSSARSQIGFFSTKPKGLSQQPLSGQFLIKNSNSNKTILNRNTNNNNNNNNNNNQLESPTQTQNLTSLGSKQQQQYKVEKVKAKVIKDGIEKEIVIKIVFYNLNHPVCSISIDEGLKKQVSQIASISKTKELLYLSHFQVISRKFQNILLHSDRSLLLPQCIIHLNHLSNLRESFRNNQPYSKQSQIRIRGTSLLCSKQGQSQTYLFPGTTETINNSSKQFSLGSLLSHISQIFTPMFESEDIEFCIQDRINNKYIPKENQEGDKKEQNQGKQFLDQNKQNNDSLQDMKILDELRSPLSSDRKRGQIEESIVYFKQPKEDDDNEEDNNNGCVSEIQQNDQVFAQNKKILNNDLRYNGLKNGKNSNLKERQTQMNKLNSSIGQLKTPFQKNFLVNQELEEDNIKTSSSRKIMNIENNTQTRNKLNVKTDEHLGRFPSQVQFNDTKGFYADQSQDCTNRDTKQVTSRMVFNDSQHICQILINLLSNSLQALMFNKPGDNGINKNYNTQKHDQILDSFTSLKFSNYPRKNTIKTSSSSVKLRSVLLTVKEIAGSDASSDLIEFKVFSQGKDIDQGRMEQLETQLKAYGIDDTTCLPLQSTQLGLRISQQLLSKVSPLNQLLIKTEEDSFEVSFLAYADASILSATSKKLFSNKTFNNLREAEFFQSSYKQMEKQQELKGQIEVPSADEAIKNNNQYLSSCSKRHNNINEDMIIELFQKSQQFDSPAMEKTQDKLFVPSNSVAALDAELSSHSNNNNAKNPDTFRIGRSQFEENNQNNIILENEQFKSFSQDYYFQRDEEEEEEEEEINGKNSGSNESNKDEKEKKKSIVIQQLNEL